MSIILNETCQIIESPSMSLHEKLETICKVLNNHDKKFTWVGFYFMRDDHKTLHLGPYVGKETDHITIPFGKGICGQVANSGTTYIADDVSAEGNYIACSIDVRSEIVIPIFDSETLVAQLDIDSNIVNAFNDKDREMLEALCFTIGEELGPDMHYEEFMGAEA